MRPLIRRRPRPCLHDFREGSTFRLMTASAVGKPMYRVYCRECGVSTEWCLTKIEAQEKARAGWME